MSLQWWEWALLLSIFSMAVGGFSVWAYLMVSVGGRRDPNDR